MFLMGSLPAILYTLLLFLVPESPRWQLVNGREAKALKTLNKLHGPDEAGRELEEIRQASSQEKGMFSELFASRLRFGIVIAVLLMFFSQFTGINAVMYFGNEVFQGAGYSKNASFWLQAIISGVTNIVFTVIAIWKIDQWGRKSLLKIGTPALLCILAAITFFFFAKRLWLGDNEQFFLLFPVLMVLFVGSFAMSWGPVPWVVVSEIFPAKIRGRAVAVGTMTIWVSCFIVAQTFPILSKRGGPEACFGLYTVCMAFAILFVWFYLPETKGKTLEEIEKELYKDRS
jgi:SP family arabinose:H+ symporter-like MFS transporter